MTAILVVLKPSPKAVVGGLPANAAATRLVTLLLFLVPPALVQAQFMHITNNGTITITGYTGSSGEVTIPGTIGGLPVTRIGNQAFDSIDHLSSVTIPDSVLSIGYEAFWYCSSLTSATIGNGVTEIGDWAFSYCTNLTRVTFGDSLTNIGDMAFTSCERLTSVAIPDGVRRVGEWAFYNCTRLADVTIGNGVDALASGLFHTCTNLASVTIGGSVTRIGSYAFNSCSNLTSITIPGGVTRIGSQAFWYCSRLTSVYFIGNPPEFFPPDLFQGSAAVIVYYLPETTGWEAMFCDRPTVLWNPHVSSDASFGVRTNRFGFIIIGSSNLVIVVEACTNLAGSDWSPRGTHTLTGGAVYFCDDQWTNHPGCYYRFRSP
jgi:hypothetical protein